MKKYLIALVLSLLIMIYNVNVVLGETLTNADLDKIKEVVELINQNYKDDISKEVLVEGAINGMMDSLDPHSNYMTKEQYERLKESLGEGFTGIGVSIKKVGDYITISGIISNSPAQKAGLMTGDKFYSIGDESAVGMNTDVFVSKARGPKGTKVKVGVIRSGSDEVIYFELIRDDIVINPVEYKVLDNKIGYIKITDFSEKMSVKVKEALNYFDTLGIEKIIIDLRGNGGGYLSEAVKLGCRFIPKGPIVSIDTRSAAKQIYISNLAKPKYKLVVLVDGGSASASEVFAGAVQDTNAGTLVGTQTYGKGTVQNIFELKDGNYLKLTIANYLTPKGRKVDGVGLTPDVVVENKSNLVSSNMFEPLNSFRNIGVGNRGYDVLAVEQRLHALGYLTEEPDYFYAASTRTAIIMLEKDYKLTRTGIITKEFQNKLNNVILEASTKDYQLEKGIQILSELYQ